MKQSSSINTACLAICNNCETVLIDENPQIDAVEHKLKGTEEEMVMLDIDENGKTDPYWACPHCKTDGYLSDM